MSDHLNASAPLSSAAIDLRKNFAATKPTLVHRTLRIANDRAGTGGNGLQCGYSGFPIQPYMDESRSRQNALEQGGALSFSYIGLSEPEPSSPLITRVDFSRFRSVRAKIDQIVFSCSAHDLSTSELKLTRKGITQGVLQHPRRKRWADFGTALAIHDPSLSDLQFLIDRFPKSRLYRLEVAVDANLEHGANDLQPLRELKAQLRHCLFPQRHLQLASASRKKYELAKKRYKTDALGTPLPDTQIIWEKSYGSDQVAVYIKETDEHIDIVQPWVRIEARFFAAGCANAGIDCFGKLPLVAHDLRTFVAPAMFVAQGFANNEEIAKGRGITKRPWDLWGAQWTAGGRAKLCPDAEANKVIGQALNDLRRSLAGLRAPIP